MLSAGRGRQLGRAGGDTDLVPWSSTALRGKEGCLLLITLFILISSPHGTAWPYGKTLTWSFLFFSCPHSFPCVSELGQSLSFAFFCSKKKRKEKKVKSAALPIPFSLNGRERERRGSENPLMSNPPSRKGNNSFDGLEQSPSLPHLFLGGRGRALPAESLCSVQSGRALRSS